MSVTETGSSTAVASETPKTAPSTNSLDPRTKTLVDNALAMREAIRTGDYPAFIGQIANIRFTNIREPLQAATEASQEWGPLEAAEDELLLALRGKKDVTVPLNEAMDKYLDKIEASKIETSAAQRSALNKLRSGKKLSEKDCLELVSLISGAQSDPQGRVIPTHFRRDTLTGQIQFFQKQYESEIVKMDSTAAIFFK